MIDILNTTRRSARHGRNPAVIAGIWMRKVMAHKLTDHRPAGRRRDRQPGLRPARRSGAGAIGHDRPPFGSIDRPETIVQRQCVAAISASARVTALATTGERINAAPNLVAQRKLADLANGGRPAGPRDTITHDAPSGGQTGLPDQLRLGIEELSGVSLDSVRVYRNSHRPAQLGAFAFAQGDQIHLAAGQEHHLPHEAWHIAQQAQGRVGATMWRNGVPINDDSELEAEASRMGALALRGSFASVDGPSHAARTTGALPAAGRRSFLAAARPAAAVAQCVIDIGTQRAALDRKTELIGALKTLATTKGVSWLPAFDTMLDADLASTDIRGYLTLDALLADMVATNGAGPLSAAKRGTKRTLDEARGLREAVKFSRTHELNPSQPNPIATGFHATPDAQLLKPPEGIRLARAKNTLRYYRSRNTGNTADFQIFTTGNPVDPGYIYTNNGQFAGNRDVKDVTKKWSHQKRKQNKRQYMDMGGQYKYPNYTVGHLQPFEHSPFVHDRPVKKGKTSTYVDTDAFEFNKTVEVPPVGEQIKRMQVEAYMMKNGGSFLQYPVYFSASPMISATFNSQPITPGQVDSMGNAVIDKPSKRPDQLVFSIDRGSGTEWAAFDNTGITRYDTNEKTRKNTGYDKRKTSDAGQWTGKRVRAGADYKQIWQDEKQTTALPYLADIREPRPSIASGNYDASLDAIKVDVPGYQTPPRTPYYLDDAPSMTPHQVSGFVLGGESVTTIAGVKGIVVDLISYDQATDTSDVLLSPEPQPFG